MVSVFCTELPVRGSVGQWLAVCTQGLGHPVPILILTFSAYTVA